MHNKFNALYKELGWVDLLLSKTDPFDAAHCRTIMHRLFIQFYGNLPSCAAVSIDTNSIRLDDVVVTTRTVGDSCIHRYHHGSGVVFLVRVQYVESPTHSFRVTLELNDAQGNEYRVVRTL